MTYTFRDPKFETFPEMVHVDITTVCNLRCIHCPQGDPAKWEDSAPAMIKEEHFRKVVDEVSRHGAMLRITCDGEPLVHPRIRSMLEYLLASDVPVATMTTNGSLWNDEMMEIILKPSKVKLVIDFSLDALYRQTYEHIRRGGDYLRVMKNVLSLIEARNRRKADHLYVIVNAINQPSARDEIELFRRFWEQVADQVIIRKYVDVLGLVGDLSGPVDQPPEERWPCLLLWSRMMVSPKGDLRFCIDDWNNQSVFAGKNIENTSIGELWQSQEYRNLRQNHLDLSFSHPLCAICNNWVGLRWEYDYRVALNSLFASGQNWGDQGTSK